MRDSCTDCNRNAPSQPPLPSIPASVPSTPFEEIFADFFEFRGRHYLAVGDRLSGWTEVILSPSGTHLAGAQGLVRCLRHLFATFGVPRELSSDGGPEFSASMTKCFLERWGVYHRIASAYHPQSNGRAEVAVKSTKRLLMSNVNPDGSLDNDRFLRAMLQLRNTPDPDCDLSPAQVVFGRPLRDAFGFINRLDKFTNPNIRPLWRDAWTAKEDALRTRFTKTSEKLNSHAHGLRKLDIGDSVFVQNQTGRAPKKWDRSGVVVEALGNDQYWVKIDGSGRLSRRNRRYLRAFTPPSLTISRNHPTGSSVTAPPSAPASHIEEMPGSPTVNAGSPNTPPRMSRDPDGVFCSPHAPTTTPCVPPQPFVSMDDKPSCRQAPEQPAPVSIQSPANPDRSTLDSSAPGPPDTPHPSPLTQRPRRARRPRTFYVPETGGTATR